MKSKIAVAILVILAFAIPTYAYVIGNFDGLEKLIDRADAIAIVRIDGDISADPRNGYTTKRCYIYQSLKGDIPANKFLPLRLMDTSGSYREKFRLHSAHIVFLNKSAKSRDEAEYQSVNFVGANIEISPFGNEKLPANLSTKETIKLLIQRYVEYRDKEIKAEDAFLEEISTF